MTPLLQVRLTAGYPGKPNTLDRVELAVNAGEIVGLVGESGSGKSTLALAILRLLEYRNGGVQGEAWFCGRDLLRLTPGEMRRIRGREIALVLQSPVASLNPALRIGAQVAEAWRAHNPGGRQEWKRKALEAFEMVNLPAKDEFLSRFPGEISVGQAQRALIAMAILHRPRLLIADEPTSALDVITQAEVLKLFERLSRELNMAMLFISHDLLSVAALCGRIAILHRGAVVETGPPVQIFGAPRHPYTRALVNSMPFRPFPPAPLLSDLQALAGQVAGASHRLEVPVPQP